MKLVFHRKLGSAEDMGHQFHNAADNGGMAKIYRHSAAVSVGMNGISVMSKIYQIQQNQAQTEKKTTATSPTVICTSE